MTRALPKTAIDRSVNVGRVYHRKRPTKCMIGIIIAHAGRASGWVNASMYTILEREFVYENVIIYDDEII